MTWNDSWLCYSSDILSGSGTLPPCLFRADGRGLVHRLAGGYDFLQMDIVLNKVLNVAKECISHLHLK